MKIIPAMENNGNDIFIRVGIVDDHVVITSVFAGMLNNMPGIRTVLEAYSGEQCLELLKSATELPDILLMDIEMKDMNGIETTKKITDTYPTIKTIAFSGRKDQWAVLQMIGAGACTYLSKYSTLDQLQEAIYEVHRKGKYQADLYHLHTGELRKYSKEMQHVSFTDNEKRYLQLLCKGYPYAQMVKEMQVSVDGVNYLKASISRKLDTKSQIIMALEALRMGIVTLYEDNKRSHKI